MAAKPIVAGTDGSEESLRAVDWAAREAALRGAPLRIVAAPAVLPRMAARVGTVEYDTVTDVLLKERDRALAAAAERAARTAPGLLIDSDPLDGHPAQAVTESGTGAQMLVLGSRGIGAFTALLLGSVSRYAASHASCPVVVVRDEAPSPHGLVGVDQQPGLRLGGPFGCGGQGAVALFDQDVGHGVVLDRAHACRHAGQQRRGGHNPQRGAAQRGFPGGPVDRPQ